MIRKTSIDITDAIQGTEIWKQKRKQYFTASKAATLIEQHPYSSLLQIYYNKINNVEPTFTEKQKIQHEIGHLIEDWLAYKYQENNPSYTISEMPLQQSITHKHMACSPDRLIDIPEIGHQLMECKNVGWRMKKDWYNEIGELEIPLYVMCQCQYSLSVMGLQSGIVLVMFIGDYEHYEIPFERDDELIELLESNSLKFWNENIEKQIEPIATHTDVKYVRQIMPFYCADYIDLDDNIETLIEEFESNNKLKKEYEKQANKYKAQIKQAIGKHERGFSKKYKVNNNKFTVSKRKVKND